VGERANESKKAELESKMRNKIFAVKLGKAKREKGGKRDAGIVRVVERGKGKLWISGQRDSSHGSHVLRQTPYNLGGRLFSLAIY
jgi:hypothetical protein